MAGRGQPGSNSRGRGGKFRKFTRGGGKHFSRNLRPLDADGNEIDMWSQGAKKKDDGSDDEEDDSEDDESSEDDDEDSDDAGPATGAGAASREDRKKEKKARKEAAAARARGGAVQVGDLPPGDSDEEDSDDDMPANPNHSKAARSQTKPRDKPVEAATEGVKNLSVGTPSRKERESMEAQQAKERYRKLHEQGKTDEAKADMARLRLIREKREAEAARKLAEKEEKEAQESAKRAEIDAKEAKKREAAMGPKSKGKGKK